MIKMSQRKFSYHSRIQLQVSKRKTCRQHPSVSKPNTIRLSNFRVKGKNLKENLV